MTQTYRNHFKLPGKAEQYDAVNYREASYDSILWQVEQEILGSVISRLCRHTTDINYLDFATGTGRVASFMRRYVRSATGIDISASMIALARQKAPDVKFACTDVTDSNVNITDQYDLITAFRFVLNAEPALRLEALTILSKLLRDESSLLIINNHGNLLSHKLLMWPYHSLCGFRQQHRLAGNYLTHPKMLELFDAAGLEVVERIGYGILSGKIAGLLGTSRAVSVERRLVHSPAASFGVCQIYVVRRCRGQSQRVQLTISQQQNRFQGRNPW